MGNTHSEALVSRERELPLQCVEVPGKEGEEDKAGRKEVAPRASSGQTAGPEPGPEAQGRENEGKAGPGAGARQPPPVGPSAAGVKAKLGPGKKRKIAKARKWASSQVASQEPVMAVERLRPIVMAELIRVQTARPGMPVLGGGGCQLPKEGGQEKQPRPNGGEAPGLDVPHPHGHELGAGPGLKHRGQGEPTGAILSHPGRHPAPGKAGKRAQLPWTAQQPQQGEAGAVRGAGGQAAVKANGNGKESPCKLIKLSIIRPPAPTTGGCKGQGPSEQQAEGPREGQGSTAGETAPANDTRPGQACPPDARPGKNVPEPTVEAAPRHGRLKAHSFLSKRGAHVEPAVGLPPHSAPPLDLPPLSPTHQASSPVAISYAQALKQAPEPRNPGQPRPAQREVEAARPETKEAGEARQAHDHASAAGKKKLPFYEQLIASLKSQAQRQKGVRPQRAAPAQEGACPCVPGKAEAETEAEEEARPVALATPEPLLLPSPGPSDPGPAPFPRPPSRSTFQFEGRVCPEQGGGEMPAWFQAPCPLGPEEQAQAYRGVSLVAPAMPASPPVVPATLDWLQPEPRATAPPPCPPPVPELEPLPVWPLAQGQAQVQIQAQPGSLIHPQCPQPAAQAPPHPQRSSGIEQPPPALALPQPTSQAEAELPTRQRPSPEPAPPTSKAQLHAETKTTPKPPAPARPRAGGARPQRQEQLAAPKAPSQPATAKARPQPQARGRKVQPSGSSQRPEPPTATAEAEADAEVAQEGKAAARPTGRWAAFQVDRTCTRTCRCRHRHAHGPSRLPRNVEAW